MFPSEALGLSDPEGTVQAQDGGFLHIHLTTREEIAHQTLGQGKFLFAYRTPPSRRQRVGRAI